MLNDVFKIFFICKAFCNHLSRTMAFESSTNNKTVHGFQTDMSAGCRWRTWVTDMVAGMGGGHGPWVGSPAISQKVQCFGLLFFINIC